MFAKAKSGTALVVVIGIAGGATSTSALAITVEVAKKCDVLTSKAYPLRQVGNPASGSAKGSSQAEQDYFNKCIANGGKVDDDGGKPGDNTPNSGDAPNKDAK